MILDKIENLETYISAFKHGKEIIEFLKTTDFNKLPFGKTKILGDELFVNYVSYTPSDNIGDFEAHRDYLDLQLIIDGEERIDYANLTKCKTTVPYDKDGDAEMLGTDNFTSLYLDKNDFAVFYPMDAHRPSIVGKKQVHVKKAIFKIKK